MAQITLDQNSNQINLVGSVVYGTEFYTERLNQFELPTADGSQVVYDGAGPNKRICLLAMKGLSYATGLVLENWIKTKIVFALNTFSMIPVTSGVDLGAGKGSTIQGARYRGANSTKGILELVAPGTWDLKFPYYFIEN